MPPPTDHLLPSFPAKGDSDAQLSTQPSASQPGQSMSNQQDDSADSDPALTKQIGRESSERVSAKQGKELGARVRKPTARREVVALTEITKGGDGLPEWISLAMAYLEDRIESKDWLECVHAWIEFEKKTGLQNSTSVSTISQVLCGSQSSPYTT